MSSCLFFTVIDGNGQLTYDGETYELSTGDCVFIDCKKVYSHETGMSSDRKANNNASKEYEDNGCIDSPLSLWSLQWCHFYGPNMNAIYRKYQEHGGRPVFRTQQLSAYRTILDELYNIVGSDDYVQDMRIHEKLSSLLILLMEDVWMEKEYEAQATSTGSSIVDIQAVKEYLDQNFTQKITLDDLSFTFFINKYYLMSLFKERYGVTINAGLNQVRVTYAKQQLRFTDKTVEMTRSELGIEATYLSRLFIKTEGTRPSEYRKNWRGK